MSIYSDILLKSMQNKTALPPTAPGAGSVPVNANGLPASLVARQTTIPALPTMGNYGREALALAGPLPASMMPPPLNQPGIPGMRIPTTPTGPSTQGFAGGAASQAMMAQLMQQIMAAQGGQGQMGLPMNDPNMILRLLQMRGIS